MFKIKVVGIILLLMVQVPKLIEREHSEMEPLHNLILKSKDQACISPKWNTIFCTYWGEGGRERQNLNL